MPNNMYLGKVGLDLTPGYWNSDQGVPLATLTKGSAQFAAWRSRLYLVLAPDECWSLHPLSPVLLAFNQSPESSKHCILPRSQNYLSGWWWIKYQSFTLELESWFQYVITGVGRDMLDVVPWLWTTVFFGTDTGKSWKPPTGGGVQSEATLWGWKLTLI